MALTKNNPATSADIIALKNRVKAEMARRKYTNSLASKATDFSQTARKDVDFIRISHFNETVGFINLIKPTGVSGSQNNPIYALQAASDALSTHAAVNINVNSESCQGATCRGACYNVCATDCRGGCKGSCQGCTGSCSGTCKGCTGNCTGTCKGCTGCTGNCSGTCKGCTGNCTGTCKGCTGNCTGTCKGCTGCTGSCSGGCKGCTGCSGTCRGQPCAADCGGTCVDECAAWGW